MLNIVVLELWLTQLQIDCVQFFFDLIFCCFNKSRAVSAIVELLLYVVVSKFIIFPAKPEVVPLRFSYYPELNNDKTEFMWCATVRRLPITGPTIGSFTVTPSSTARDLGVYMTRVCRCSHVQRTISRCFAVLRQLRIASGGRYQLQCSTSSRLLLHSSYLDWTIVTAFCLYTACQPHHATPTCSERCCTAYLQNPKI